MGKVAARRDRLSALVTEIRDKPVTHSVTGASGVRARGGE